MTRIASAIAMFVTGAKSLELDVSDELMNGMDDMDNISLNLGGESISSLAFEDEEEDFLMFKRGLVAENTTDCNPISNLDFGEVAESCCGASEALMGTISSFHQYITQCPVGAGNCEANGKTPKSDEIATARDVICGNNHGCGRVLFDGLLANSGSLNAAYKSAVDEDNNGVADICNRPVGDCGPSFTPDDLDAVATLQASPPAYILSCKAGFVSDSGANEKVVCLPDSTFSNDTMLCNPKDCGEPEENTQVNLSCNNANLFESVCTATCKTANHVLTGSNMECKVKTDGSGDVAWDGGNWSCAPPPSACTVADDAFPNSASNTCGAEVAHLGTCNVVCAAGYDLQGEVKCEDGTFTKMAKCMAQGQEVEEVTYIQSALTLELDISNEDLNKPEFEGLIKDSIASGLSGVNADDVEILSINAARRRQLLAATDAASEEVEEIIKTIQTVSGIPAVRRRLAAKESATSSEEVEEIIKTIQTVSGIPAVRRRLSAKDVTIDFRVKVEGADAGAVAAQETAMRTAMTTNKAAFGASFKQQLETSAADAGITVTVTSIDVEEPTTTVESELNVVANPALSGARVIAPILTAAMAIVLA